MIFFYLISKTILNSKEKKKKSQKAKKENSTNTFMIWARDTLSCWASEMPLTLSTSDSWRTDSSMALK